METRIRQLQTALFDGIPREDFGAMLHCTGYHVGSYHKGQVIILEEEHIYNIGIVLSGSVDMLQTDIWGDRTLLIRIRENGMFGETFACSDNTRSVVSFAAAEDSQILFIPFHRIMRTCSMSCEFHHKLIENMVRIIASKNQDLMRKVEVISRKSLREKILAYLSIQAQGNNARYFQIPLSRSELADYLCADRSALTRELSSMRAEGIIDFEKNTFRILS